jgi:prolyl-tRNA editing enzyme YbaK/EbsC (Cys-tRNA(Pro) deacylase)
MIRIRFEGLRATSARTLSAMRAPLSSLGLPAQRTTSPIIQPMHPNVSRVTEAAAAAGLEITVERFPEGTRTAQDAARAVGCAVSQIVKSLVFVADGRPVLALVSGADRVDLDRLAAAMSASTTRRATGDEARSFTGYAIGGVPPLGHHRPLTVLVDRGLLAHDEVWAAAGLPDAVFALAPAELVRASGGRVVDLADASPA